MVVNFLGADPASIRGAGPDTGKNTGRRGRSPPSHRRQASSRECPVRKPVLLRSSRWRPASAMYAVSIAAARSATRRHCCSAKCCPTSIPTRRSARARALDNVWKSRANTLIDLGDDVFTRGRPHPMIDHRLRNERIGNEAQDPQTAVILLDVVLGYGAHADPASEIAPVIERRSRKLRRRGGMLRSSASSAARPPIRRTWRDRKRDCARLGCACRQQC